MSQWWENIISESHGRTVWLSVNTVDVLRHLLGSFHIGGPIKHQVASLDPRQQGNRSRPRPPPSPWESANSVSVNPGGGGMFWWDLWFLSAVDIPLSAAWEGANKLLWWRTRDNGEESVLQLPADLNWVWMWGCSTKTALKPREKSCKKNTNVRLQAGKYLEFTGGKRIICTESES